MWDLDARMDFDGNGTVNLDCAFSGSLWPCLVKRIPQATVRLFVQI